MREIERFGEPVDLVGHDWGGFLAVRVASVRGEILRSWASDALGLFDDSFEWHGWAKTWQIPGKGEAWVERALATPVDKRAAVFERFGVPHDAALTLAGWFDATMGESMLALYRSAVEVPAAWTAPVDDIRTPGLAIVPSGDPWARQELVRRVAARAHAETIDLVGLGHWWMLEQPGRCAAALERFWSSSRLPARDRTRLR
jgi:pimeloyl-ACP methyl ester carboxylesterase